ncbi:MAG: hypothetical protein ACE5OS_01820 [Anaerolineae bacterium]
MNRQSIAVVILLCLTLLFFGCSSETTPEVPPASALDQMPLLLARPLFANRYELAGYYELDVNGDGVEEVLAVATLNLPLEQSSRLDSHVILFVEYGGSWSLTDHRSLDGVNARAELRDLTGDGLPELLVFTEEAESQLGDFVTPLHYTDHVTVFTYTPEPRLMQLETFSSSLSGSMRPHSVVGKWGGQPAIQTMQDIPPTGSPLWWPYRVETFAWDGQGFASRQVRERRRISPIVSWLVRRNVPWAAVFLTLGGVFSLVVTVVARRSRLQERWVILGLALLVIAGGVGLGLVQEWLCVPALILIGLGGSGIGRQMAARTIAKSSQDTETESGE